MAKRVLAIIPARGGSKGLPLKNIKMIAGKPLLAWTIEAAFKSKLIDQLIVSTDDQEIADVARKLGASVPFLRPTEFATDVASGMQPVFHALGELPGFDYVVLLQPTSPLRDASDIDGSIQKCLTDGAVSCVSVTESLSHPNHCYLLDDRGQMTLYVPNPEKFARRQDMPRVYCLNGAVYVAKVAWLKENKSFVGSETVSFVMPKDRSVDIDDLYDFEIAEFLIKKRLQEKGD